MKYSVQKHEKYTLFSLEEERLMTSLAPQLKAEFVTLYQSGTVNLILDLSQVQYIDSSGLSALLVVRRLANEAGGLVVLAAVTEHVLKLLALSKLDTVFEIMPTIQEATDAVFLHEIEKDMQTDEEESAGE